MTVTGELFMDVWELTYGGANYPNWMHQIGVSPWDSWGDAAKASVTGTGSAVGDCRTNGVASFPLQSLAPANDTSRQGEFGAITTATAVNAVGSCQTTWNVVFSVPGYPNSSLTWTMSDMACDNATGANASRPARVGCAIWWYPAQVGYSSSRNPTLAAHVRQAQAHGLPGATVNDPLNRTTSDTITKVNRDYACGDAPSIANMSCDEYPLASTHQGLAFGGTRRTFPGCNINAPTNVTGPTGASACMIAKGDNDAQGGIMAGFYYDNRVLEGDPFRVGIVP